MAVPRHLAQAIFLKSMDSHDDPEELLPYLPRHLLRARSAQLVDALGAVEPFLPLQSLRGPVSAAF